MKRWLRQLSPHTKAAWLYRLVRLIGATVRLTVEWRVPESELPRPRIYAGWHGRTFIATRFFRNQGVWTLISQSRDGEMQNQIFKRFGFQTIRGSTARGGVRAAVEAIKVLRTGAVMAFTPDGPRGPSGVVQEGILLMAQKSGAAIVPCGVSARRRWLARSWDRYLIPKPFTPAIMIFGAPLAVPSDADATTLETIRCELEQAMHELEREAERRMGHAPD